MGSSQVTHDLSFSQCWEAKEVLIKLFIEIYKYSRHWKVGKKEKKQQMNRRLLKHPKRSKEYLGKSNVRENAKKDFNILQGEKQNIRPGS